MESQQSDLDILDQMFALLQNRNGSIGLNFLISKTAPSISEFKSKYFKSILDTSPLINRNPGYGDEQFYYTLNSLGIQKLHEFGSYSAVQSNIPQKSVLNYLGQSKFPEDPGEDIQRLDLIFKILEALPISAWRTISSLIKGDLRWSKITQVELFRIEKLVVGTDLVEYRHEGGAYFQNLRLTPSGRKILEQHKLYSNYVNPKTEYQKFISYCDVFAKWIARGKKAGVTYPLSEIEEFWVSKSIDYDLQEIIDYFVSKNYLVTYIGPFYGPNQNLINLLREASFGEVATKTQSPTSIQHHIHIENLQTIAGSNNTMIGSGSQNDVKNETNKNDPTAKKTLTWTVIGVIVAILGIFVAYLLSHNNSN